jgi:hypothetical protein
VHGAVTRNVWSIAIIHIHLASAFVVSFVVVLLCLCLCLLRCVRPLAFWWFVKVACSILLRKGRLTHLCSVCPRLSVVPPLTHRYFATPKKFVPPSTTKPKNQKKTTFGRSKHKMLFCANFLPALLPARERERVLRRVPPHERGGRGCAVVSSSSAKTIRRRRFSAFLLLHQTHLYKKSNNDSSNNKNNQQNHAVLSPQRVGPRGCHHPVTARPIRRFPPPRYAPRIEPRWRHLFGSQHTTHQRTAQYAHVVPRSGHAWRRF